MPEESVPDARTAPARRRLAWIAGAASVGAVLAISLFIAVNGHEVDIDVYLMGAQHAFRPSLYTVQLGRSGLLFTYTPWAALLFVPLQRTLTLVPAQAIWTAGNVLALLWLVATSIRCVRPHLERRELIRWTMLLSLPALMLDPVFLSIGLGQVNVIVVALVLWDLAGVPAGGDRPLPLGMATGLAAAVKLTPLIFVPYLLLTRRPKGAMTCMATFVACQAVAFAFSPSASIAYWTKDVFDPQRAGALNYISDQNLVSALERFNHGVLPNALHWSIVLAVGVAGILVAVMAQRRSSDLLGVLACACTSLLVSPVTWAHHMVWIVPATGWLAAAADRPRRGIAWAAGAALLFWASPLWWVPRSWRLPGHFELHEHGWQLLAGNSFFLATAGFLTGAALILVSRWYSGLQRGALGAGAAG